MFKSEDLRIICCPRCKSDFTLDGDILTCKKCAMSFPIFNGIPRLLYFGDENSGSEYNTMWDFKWTELDKGKGYNWQIIEKDSDAYKIHNVFRFFSEDFDSTFSQLNDGKTIALDIGCGIGQYSVSLLDKGVDKVYALDLSRGVDIGKKLFEERLPHLIDKVVFIQANARFLPIRTESIDFGMALASIHHSGFLEECIKELVRIVKLNKKFMVWIYAKPLLPIGESNRNFKGLIWLTAFCGYHIYTEFLLNIFRRLPNRLLLAILKVFASDTVFFIKKIPGLGIITTIFMPGINNHKEKGYRLINLYDAYSPSFAEASDEADIIGWSEKYNFRIIGFSTWRLGFLGKK